MSFNIVITADSAQAEANIGKLLERLLQVEGASGKAKESTGSLFKDTASAADQAAKAFGALADQFQREADMLERIRGPAREYAADMQALNMLMQKGAISAEEYRTQVERLNEELERSKRSPKAPEEGGFRIEGIGQTLAAQGGEAGEIFGTLASKGMIEASALAAVATEAIHLGDEYIVLQNNALRLAGSQDKVDQTIQEQLGLSKQLHGSLEQTMELSTLVKERTESLGLTEKQRTQFTKELAEASQLSGHAMGDAANVMNRLGFALESGLPAGRDLRNVMREFPAIADALTEHFHATQREIVEMGNKGKISLYDLQDALAEAGDSLDEKFGQRAETASQQWQHFKDEMVVVVGQLVESTHVIELFGAGLQGLAKIIEASLTPIRLLKLGLQDFNDWMDQKLGGGSLKMMHEALLQQVKDHKELEEATFSTTRSMSDLTKTVDEYGKIAAAVIGKLATEGPLGLVDPWASAEAHVKAHKAALSEDEKMLQSINGPMNKLMASEKALAELYADGAISAARYATEAQKLRDELEKLNAAAEKLAFHTLDQTFGGLGSAIGAMSKRAGSALAGYGAGITPAAEAVGKAAEAADIEKAKQALQDYNKQAEQTKQILEAGFRPLGNELVKLAETGKFSFSSMADSIIGDLLRMEVKWLELKAIGFLQGAINGPAPGSDADFLSTATSIAEHVDGAQLGGYGTIPQAALGWSGRVPGWSPPDTNLFMARVSPGERVQITPSQHGGGGGAAPQVHANTQIINRIDKADIADLMAGPEGGRAVINHIRLNASAIKGMLR